MKTILMSAYAVNPLKGSEDGMGWNYIVAAARSNKVIAVTRRNNRKDIEAFINTDMSENQQVYGNITFLYFDWPKWMLFWKKGPLLSMIYYYFWQLSLVVWLKVKAIDCDIVHNLNFHNDWTPSFLWLLNKKFVWGPVGHHPRIPKAFAKVYGSKEYLKDTALWALKWCFWNLDPLLFLTKKKAKSIWCMHEDAANKLNLNEGYFVHPSIAAESVEMKEPQTSQFTVLSVGRFVPLKGFDVTVKSFAEFYRTLSIEDRNRVRLVLVGKGPCKQLIKDLIVSEGIQQSTVMLDWMSQNDLHQLYSDASVFLYPSHEGAGMVVAEAMRYNTPVVCWNNMGPGTIIHTESNLKVEYESYSKSVNSFAEKLKRLLTDISYYQKEADLAGQRFKASLSWDVKAEQLNQFYNLTAENITFKN
jgi:glycosyltransferase involved in cell wall biosynthesis